MKKEVPILDDSGQEVPTVSIEAAMDRLSATRAQVYRMIKAGTLKATKVDAVLRFAEDDLSKTLSERAEGREAVAKLLSVIADKLTDAGVTDLLEIDDQDEDKTIEELARRLTLYGVASGATDIFVTPSATCDRLLVRRDGRVLEVGSLESELASLLKTKLKALASLSTAETGKRGEAVFSQAHGEHSSQVRIGVFPGSLGEQVHLQFHDPGKCPTFKGIGYSPRQTTVLQQLLNGQPGLFVLAGSHDQNAYGQRLAIAHYLNRQGRIVVSIERRLNFRIDDAMQLSLANSDEQDPADQWLGAMQLRPDAIMLDTIQDSADARAVHSAIAAGVLIVLQVPAASTSAALNHLLELDGDPIQLARNLLAVSEYSSPLKLCSNCRSPRPCTEEEGRLLGVSPNSQIFEATGCDRCARGYQGNRTVYGLLPREDALVAAIRGEGSLNALIGGGTLAPALSLSSALREVTLSGEVEIEHVRHLL